MSHESPIEPLGLSQYTPVARIGSGGQAEIILALHHGDGGFQRPVVIKRLWPHIAADPRSHARLVQEAQLVAQIHHPGVCQVLTLINSRQGPLLVLEYLPGITMATVTRRLPEQRSIDDVRFVIACLQQASEGLHHAHNTKLRDGRPANLVHRDVSGNNILVTRDGVAKVLDFGLARADSSPHSVTLRGTAAFMSPEQVQEIDLDRRSDVFSLAVLAYESMTGRGLFRRRTHAETLLAITNTEAPSFCDLQPEVPRALEAVILKGLSKDREQRYSTARAFGEAMTESLKSVGGPMRFSEVADYLKSNFEDEFTARQQQVESMMRAHTGDASMQEPSDDTKSVALEIYEQDWLDASLLSLPAVDFSAADLSADDPSAALLPPPPKKRWPLILAAAFAFVTAGVITVLATGGPSSPSMARAEEPSEPDARASVQASGPADAAPVVDARSAPPPDAPLPIDAGAAKTTTSKTVKSPKRPPRDKPVAAGKPGFFTIDSRPFADIYIDRKRRGRVPLYKLRLSPGKHSVRATLSDGRSKSFSITIRSGKELRKRIAW